MLETILAVGLILVALAMVVGNNLEHAKYAAIITALTTKFDTLTGKSAAPVAAPASSSVTHTVTLTGLTAALPVTDPSGTVTVTGPLAAATSQPSAATLPPPPAGVIVDPAAPNSVIGPFGVGNGALSILRVYSGEDTMVGVPTQRASYALNAACDAALAGVPAHGAQWAAAYAAGVSAPLAAAFIAQFNASNAPVVTG